MNHAPAVVAKNTKNYCIKEPLPKDIVRAKEIYELALGKDLEDEVDVIARIESLTTQ